MSNEPLSLMYSAFGVHQSALSNARQSSLPSMASDYSQRLTAIIQANQAGHGSPKSPSAIHQVG